MDGDGQMNPEYLDKLIMPIIEKKADYVPKATASTTLMRYNQCQK